MAAERTARTLAKLCGTYHNITYYAPEIKAFRAVGVPRYWHAYLGYRSAPLGRVPASVVVATFYNFAPSMVEAAIPFVWEQITPDQAIALRDECVDRALSRALGAGIAGSGLAEAARIVGESIAGCDIVGRPLFAAHAELPWPEPPHLQLHHACTLWREHRGDGHNIALAAADIDGIECHVLLAGRGIADRSVIQRIRGWSAAEWDAAVHRLEDRGLVDGDGSCTSAGHRLRAAIEDHTDRLAGEPVRRLGDDGARRLIDVLDPIVRQLVVTGAVAATWPPKR